MPPVRGKASAGVSSRVILKTSYAAVSNLFDNLSVFIHLFILRMIDHVEKVEARGGGVPVRSAR
jgi:hypothetical protein